MVLLSDNCLLLGNHFRILSFVSLNSDRLVCFHCIWFHGLFNTRGELFEGNGDISLLGDIARRVCSSSFGHVLGNIGCNIDGLLGDCNNLLKWFGSDTGLLLFLGQDLTTLLKLVLQISDMGFRSLENFCQLFLGETLLSLYKFTELCGMLLVFFESFTSLIQILFNFV